MENQGRHLRQSRTGGAKKRTWTAAAARGILVLVTTSLLLIAILLIAGAIGTERLFAPSIALTPEPRLNPLEAAYLKGYLAANYAALQRPMSDDTAPITIKIVSGESASDAGEKLREIGVISDAMLFRNYMRYTGLDTQIEAGTYQLTPHMIIPEIGIVLTKGTPTEITLSIPEGWRREQIADWLSQNPNLAFRGDDFTRATLGQESHYSEFKNTFGIPANASLEGFLFPDTYKVSPETGVADFVDKMLANFFSKVTDKMRADASARGLSIFEVATLASIVERETAVGEERPIVASVYLNRLAQGIPLDADPTVQYAMGYQQASGTWWNLALDPSDYTRVDSPYNTYLHSGLPPGPIANPGIDSIAAVIYPASTPYIYFRARCDGSGRHSFSVTFEEHLANACP